jgi:hypothetical protein
MIVVEVYFSELFCGTEFCGKAHRLLAMVLVVRLKLNFAAIDI